MQNVQNSSMNTLGKKIKDLLAEKKIPARRVAQHCNVTPGAVSNWFSTGKINRENLVKVAELLDVSVESLMADDDNVVVDLRTQDLLARFGKKAVTVGDITDTVFYIHIKEYAIKFAAGNGRTATFEEIAGSQPATYRTEWFTRNGINPNNAIRVKVHGDSMEPCLYDGDSVLINLAETQIQNGKVYGLRYGDELRVKRVYRKLDGTLILKSDNPTHIPREEEIPTNIQDEHIAIIGRVRDKSGSGGL